MSIFLGWLLGTYIAEEDQKKQEEGRDATYNFLNAMCQSFSNNDDDANENGRNNL